MNVPQFITRNFFSFRFEIRHLTRNEFAAASCDRDLAQNFSHRITACWFCASGDFKCDRQQRIAGKDRDAVTENFVAGSAATSEIVVVHARQIVVD